MPVVGNATKMWSRQNSNATLSENFRRMDVAFTEAYQVFTTHDTTELEVYLAPGLPQVAQSYPGFPFVYARATKLERVSPVFWIATVDYQGEIGGTGGGAGGTEPSPLFAPPIIKFDDVETEEEIDVDFLGNPIINTAGERVRGVKALFSDQVLTVTRNFATFNTYVQAVYRRSVNSDVFQGWPAGTVKLMKLSADNVFDVNVGYWKVTGVFQFRYPYNTTPTKAWYNRRVSMGLKQRKGSTGDDRKKLIPTVDGHKQPATTPQYLDQFGIQIPFMEEDASALAAPPFWQETQLYGSLPYNALGLI
jgi:hypothetical protein